jgi:dTDP-4-dehydrorhamnose 3,5-epimerase
MRRLATDVAGAFIVVSEVHEDARGSFIRVWCRDTFRDLDLDGEPAQVNLSFNPQPGTLRGLHAQRPPYEEAKLVTCVSGSLFDVAVDLRRDSRSYGRYAVVTLRAGDGRSFFIPKGCGHGFQTLEANTTIAYQITTPFVPEARAGVRWDDPRLAIPWPLPPSIVSDADLRLPNFDEATQS